MKETEYVRETIELVKSIETRFLELGARLYKIKDKELWQGTYDSYYEFLDAAHINPSMASMLVKVHDYYIIKGGQKPAQLRSIGYSNLYQAIPLIERDGVETTLIKAQTLTRSEIVDEVREDKCGKHDCVVGTERFGICKTCKKFIRVDK
jgi:hypothetical protein